MNEIIELIKIGGPVSAVSVLFLWFFDRMDKRHTTLISNHMEHNTDALNKNSVILKELSTLIKILGKTLKGKVISDI